jgi:TetR/AcrR family transcriptional regulator, ethionamide resistance regulator
VPGRSAVRPRRGVDLIDKVLIYSTLGYDPGMTPSATPRSRPSRGRRGSRPSGDDRELAILTTAEQLLGERPMAEISIDELARGAGISRPTFYFYFASKDAVLLTLLDRLAAEASASAAVITVEQLAAEPRRRWREAIDAFFRTFSARPAIAVACAQAQHTNAEVRELWASVMSRSVLLTAQAIQAERQRGAAPPGIPPYDLAVALNQMNERAMFAAFAEQQPAIAREDVVDVLLDIWLCGIYHTPDPPKSGS